MSSKTTFLFAVVVALALFGSSAFAVPLQVINAPSTDDVENITPTPSETVPVQEQQAKSSDAPAETPVAVVGTEPSQQVQQKQDAKTDEVVQSAVASEVPPVAADAESGPGTKTEPESPAAEPDVEIIEVFKPLKFDGPRPPVPATPALGQSNPETQPNAVFGKPAPLIPAHQKPNRYYPNDVQPVKLGLDMPFTFMEYLQPFHQAGHNQPPRHQQQPFGASVDPFEPFISPMMGSPLNRLVEAYTNEFRNMLNAFDASISQMHNNMGAPQTIPEKPVTKTTSKTEVIDGHLVQINETTYSNGDGNHKSFYHFKEIQVLPDNKTKTITNENSMSVTKDERDEETNEIKRDQPSGTFVASSAVVVDDETQNLIKKVE
ncbi:Hypothetical protein CINCED_3A012225 [Cinara cedri]|uniref:Insect cuticle protein n=1 Tax=Cinara cedri TaxID=506608 RepID=A0A5E4MXS3_9HEMI|nr:Hypothetical protein CINCED_3A012225 [Cinara cedri]